MTYRSEQQVGGKQKAVGSKKFLPSAYCRLPTVSDDWLLPTAYCRLPSGWSRLPTVSDGFTLVELLVVMVIIGLLAALVVPRFIRQEEKAKVKAAQAQIELLGTALDTFRLDVGRYPSTQEGGLEALRRQPGGAPKWDGPYLKKEVPLDPWGRPYIYESPGKHGPYDLYSYGADGVAGGDGDNRDVTSWEG